MALVDQYGKLINPGLDHLILSKAAERILDMLRTTPVKFPPHPVILDQFGNPIPTRIVKFKRYNNIMQEDI